MKQRKGLDPIYFAFKWMSVMFSREFAFPDVLRLWDSVFSEIHGKPCLDHSNLLSKLFDYNSRSAVMDFLIQFACGKLICSRRRLLQGDFTENLEYLQNGESSLDDIFAQIEQMRTKRSNKSFHPKQFMEKLKIQTSRYTPWNPFSKRASSETLDSRMAKDCIEKSASIPRVESENQLQSRTNQYSSFASLGIKTANSLDVSSRVLGLDLDPDEVEALN
jgi:hypothetical protein